MARRLLLDTNLLILAMVGEVARDRVGQAKRVRGYDPHHYDLLDQTIAGFGELATIPNILTEASNLIGSGEREVVPGAARALAAFALRAVEAYPPSRDVVTNPAFLRLGLTDAAVMTMVREDLTILTDDHALYGALEKRGAVVLNFLHRIVPRSRR